MDKKIELLERFYNSFMNEQNPKDFFIGFADYIDFIDTDPELDKIANNLLSQIKSFDNKLKELEQVALKKLAEIHKEFLAYIRKNKIDNNVINNAFKEYDNWLNGRIVGGGGLVYDLHDQLCDIVRKLQEMPEHKEFACRYSVFYNDKEKTLKNYLYIKEVYEYEDALSEFKEKYKNELWGQVNEAIHFYKIIKRGKEKHKELVEQMKGKKHLKATLEILNHNSLLAEWQFIERGETRSLIFFKISKIRPVMVRFQNYLIKELSKKDDSLRAIEALNDLQSRKLRAELTNPLKNNLDEIEKKSLRTEMQSQIIEKIAKDTRLKNIKQKEFIKKITIIELKNGKRLISINDNYKETKQIKNSEWWNIFIKEIKERGMINRTNIKEIPKGMADYFNYNKEKCPIYTSGKYDLTDIFVGRSRDTKINPEIKTKIITENQYLARKNRKKKK